MRKVAIIGMSYRFPGTTPDRYWADLLAGRDLVTRIDPSRWALETYEHPEKSHPGTSYTFAAGCLGDVSRFDAEFFGISPREAAQMDPQQRLLLEMGWEALESAGIRPRELRGARAGVFIGISSADYAYRLADDLGAVDSAIATGNTSSVSANRLSYFFDLRGPSLAVDTACSSSMVALHLACRSVASGESRLALAGGVSLLLHPFGFVAFSKASMLSRTGRCRVFDAAGDGYVRSEGGGLFVLKDLDEALADGDPVLAVIAGTGANADGRKTGLTVPGRAAQAALLQQVYEEAGIAAADIDYLEAHGTGTAVGDPIEAGALGDAIGRHRPAGRPLLIGSVKSNLGHLEAASGVAGLVKAVHCVRERMVPASIHFETPNPHIAFDEWNLRVATAPTALPASGRIVVGVNSFGFGGANAHAILESAPPEKVRPIRAPSPPPTQQPALPVVVSGRTDAALRDAARALAAHLRSARAPAFHDVAWSATCRREWHEHRAVVLGATARSVAGALDRFAQGEDTPGAVVAATALPSPVSVAFAYTGNGSQWEGMGARLLAEDATFRAAVQAVELIFEQFSDLSVLDELAGRNPPGSLARTEVAQPALFAMQVGITEMLRARGIVPALVVGHSVGEVAAAWASGALPLEQAVRLVHVRSLLQARTRGTGQMTALGTGAEEARTILAELGLADALAIAGENSPRGLVVAGPVAALEVLEDALTGRGTFFRRLDLDYAFHSPAMDAIRDDLERDLGFLKPRATRVRFVSTVTGAELAGPDLDAAYWWRNVRDPVLFAAATRSARALGANLFVEVGPHAVLRGYLNDSLKVGTPGRAIATLVRGDGSPGAVSRAALQAMLAGAPVDLKAFFPLDGRLVPLPGYPWQRERHWIEPTPASLHLLDRFKAHPLLGYRSRPGEPAWENSLDARAVPALADHVVGGSVVFPGAGFVEMAIAAAGEWRGEGADACLDLEDLEIHAPLLFVPGHSATVRLAIDGADGGFAIRAHGQGAADAWHLHATGRILAAPREAPHFAQSFEPPAREPDFDAAAHLALAHRAGLDYGPAFQAVAHGWVGDGEVLARFAPPADEAGAPAAMAHVARLDGAFQLLVHLMKDEAAARPGVAFVPVRAGRLQVAKERALPAFARTRIVRRAPRSLTAEISLFDESGRRVAWLRGVRFRSVPLRKPAVERLHFLAEVAVPMPRADAPAPRDAGFEALARAAFAKATAGPAGLGTQRRYAEEAEPLLDAWCVALAERFAGRLADAGAWVGDAALAAACDGRPGAAPRAAAMMALLERDGLAGRDEDGWRLAGASGSPPPEDIWNSLVADHPQFGDLLGHAGRAGQALERIAAGAQEAPVAPAAVPDLLAQVLGGDGAHALRAAARECVGALLRLRGEGARVGLVEVSRGVPLFTPSLLRAFDPDRLDCMVLTPCAETAEWCRQSHDEFPGLRVQLAGDGAGEGEGQAEGTAALALVVNDFADEAEALALLGRARRALAPDGTLVLVGLPRSRWMDILPAAPSALLPASRWRAQLDALSLDVPDEEGDAARPFVLVGHAAVREGGSPESPADARTWFVLRQEGADDGGLYAGLRAALEAAGGRVAAIELPAGAPVEAATLARSLAGHRASHGEAAALVDLTAFGAPAAGDPAIAGPVRACTLLAALAQACEEAALRAECWVVTEAGASGLLPGRAPGAGDVPGAATWGFVRSMMNEPGALALRLAGVERDAATGRFGTDVAAALAREIRYPDAEREVALAAGGARFASRVREMPRPGARVECRGEDRTARLGLPFAGQLRHLHWESVERRAPAGDEVEIEVAATGLNFRDVMYALGLLADEAVESGFAGASLGLECAGTVARVGPDAVGFAPGERVVAFGAHCFGRHATVPSRAVARVPESLAPEAAATVPIAFFTAWYALRHLARLAPGERVLVHGAAGGVGLAAIQVARHLGAEVFATAGSDDKRDYLRLSGVRHVFDSRSLAFADEVLAATGGEGVDVVLNSLAGEAINRNLRALRPFGRLMELGKRDFYENTRVGLRPFRNNISYHGIDADQLMQEHPELAAALFAEVMALFAEGALHALPFRAFEADDVVEAFRFMQQSRHTGKIVVTYRSGVHRMHAHAPLPPLRLRPDATYLVTGGLGGFGLRTAQCLARKGARHLVLASRSGPASEEARAAVAALEADGVKVLAAAASVADRAQMGELLARAARELPPIAGVIHAAAVIEDALARNATAEQLGRVLAPKLAGAMILDELTRGLPLDFFVLYSSATTLFGNPGQAAYVAANTAMEALARSRRAEGLPALAVRWGPIEDAGFLARNEEVRKSLQSRLGGRMLRAGDALAVLEGLLAGDEADRAVLDLDWPAIARLLPSASHPRFAELARRAAGGEAGEFEAIDIRRLMAELGPEELLETVKGLLKSELSAILRIPPEKMEDSRSVYDMGMDSLMGVELALALEQRFGIRVPVMILGENPTLERLAARVVAILRDAGESAPDAATALAGQVGEMASQHAVEVDRGTIEQFASQLRRGDAGEAKRIIG